VKLPPPWLRERNALERLREVRHLMEMQQLEALAKYAGRKIRPDNVKSDTQARDAGA
jgi:hypothetical protein